MSKIHFVGGEKGGVGKSVVARVLAQYCIDKQLPFRAIDADGSHGTFSRFYADYVTPVDLSVLESADQILDAAEKSEGRVLVDLPAQSDRLLSSWISGGGILDLAREAQVGLIFWHVLDNGKDSVVTLERSLARYGDAVSYCVVKNLGRGADFSLFDQSDARKKAEAFGATILELPELHGPVMQRIDRQDKSFWGAINSPDETFSRVDRQRAKVWLTSAFDQVARLGDRF